MKIFQKNKLKFLALAFAGIVGFSVFGLSEDVIAQTGGCEVIDADFRSGASYPEDAFTYPNNRPFVYVDVETENCIGQNIRITIRNQVGFDNAESLGFGQSGSEEAADINVADETPILVSENNFTLAYVATEESCYSNLSLGWFAGNWNLYGWDCAYFIMLEDSTGWSVYENEYGENYTENSALQYDCTDGIVGIYCPADPLDWAFHGIHPFGYISPEDQFNYTPPNLSYQGADFYLAPLPGFSDQTGCQNPPCSRLGDFLRGFFTLLIIVAGLLAFIMIVVGGITWATSDAISGKSEGKEMIGNAVLGLILALGSWVILNTINPNLASNLGITIPVVTLDQKAFEDYETPISGQGGQSGFILAGTFENPATSPGLTQFLQGINDSNEITMITVNTGFQSMTITNAANQSVVIPVTGFGENGIAEVGQGQEDDRKTPKGNWLITSDIRIAPNANQAVNSRNGYNMGPAFIGNNITIPNTNRNRGIGIHGNYNNNPMVTAGCVRIKNDDVLALARKITSGVQFIIQ